jgi:hypothetical protein
MGDIDGERAGADGEEIVREISLAKWLEENKKRLTLRGTLRGSRSCRLEMLELTCMVICFVF